MYKGRDYVDGSSLCMPAVVNEQFGYGVYSCAGGAWKQQNSACGESQKLSCEIDGSTYSLGATVLLGEGPSHLECTFPGNWALKSPAASGNGPPASRPVVSGRQVKRAQAFLFGKKRPEFDPKACSPERGCDGQMSAATRDAILAYVRSNFDSLDAGEKAQWGTANLTQLPESFRKLDDLDVIFFFNQQFEPPVLAGT